MVGGGDPSWKLLDRNPRFNEVQLDLARLPAPLARAAQQVARRLAEAGYRAWLVGGAPRDLLRGEAPSDVDLVSAAPPEEVERLFERTVPVGRAFGIVIVVVGGLEVEVATFRAERGYSDGRRPDEVRFGASLEQDAARRDFTCNALYLDPLTGELADPSGGRADLAAGRLRCVGDARERFAEDGLRILRLGRFAARLGLEPEPETLRAARASLDALRGVSAERVLAELEGIFTGPEPARACELLVAVGALERVLPLWARASRVPAPVRLAALRALGSAPGLLAGLALWLEADPLGAPSGAEEPGLAQLEALRPPAVLRAGAVALWRLRPELGALAAEGASPSARTLALREGPWREAIAVERAWRAAQGRGDEDLRALGEWRAARSEAELRPRPLVEPADLTRLGVPRGPRWGAALRAAEAAQIDGSFRDRAGALAWLAAHVAGRD